MTNKTIAHISCGCPQEFQDKKYGKQVRVANLTQKGTGNVNTRYVRCTSCGKEHLINEGVLK